MPFSTRKLVEVIRDSIGCLAMLLAAAGWFWFTVSRALVPATRISTVLPLAATYLSLWLLAVLMKEGRARGLIALSSRCFGFFAFPALLSGWMSYGTQQVTVANSVLVFAAPFATLIGIPLVIERHRERHVSEALAEQGLMEIGASKTFVMFETVNRSPRRHAAHFNQYLIHVEDRDGLRKDVWVKTQGDWFGLIGLQVEIRDADHKDDSPSTA